MKRWLFLLLGAAVALLAQPLAAQTAEDFYKGKKIDIIIGFTPGGSYDLYARTLAEFMPRHIAGQPQIIVQNKPGAATLNAAQHVYKIAAADGLTIAMTGNLLPLEQLLEGKNAKLDMSKARWLGNLVELTSAVTVWHTQGVKTLADLKAKEVVFGATGPSGETYMIPIIVNQMLGTKIKMVTGYPGITEVMVAMERGEVGGRSGSWQNVTQRPHWIAEKKIIAVLQVGVRKHRDLPNVPLLSEVVTDPGDKRIADLISASLAISRAPWLAPGTPEDRVKTLRAAFMATVKDPEFLKTAKSRNVDIDAMPGDEVEKRLSAALSVPPEQVARLRKMMALDK